MVSYLGPGDTVAKILEKQDVVYGVVASYNVMMQQFYLIVQEKTL